MADRVNSLGERLIKALRDGTTLPEAPPRANQPENYKAVAARHLKVSKPAKRKGGKT